MSERPTNWVGPYEIVREIGRGGMGVVYLARDTKLDREVAIKCLPDELADDPDRLARLEREAKTLAALNHPNIAAIYGLEVVDGRRYLILEYVEGETLEARLGAGPMPLDETLEIGVQIAHGIEAAHACGIIHRDLKPGNIKLAPGRDGEVRVKVLDFGIAKAMADEHATVEDLSTSPTVEQRGSPTTPGMILGTPGYLSPEQARGHPINARTDVFAFGCVLFEMLAGRCPFVGDTASDCIGAALHTEPSFEFLRADTPGSVRRLLRRCLAKDQRRRLQAIGDARLELEEATVAEPEPGGGGPGRSSVAGLIPWGVAASLAIGLVLLAWKFSTTSTSVSAAGSRWTITLPESARIEMRSNAKYDYSRLIALAPDGTVAMTTRDENETAQLRLKRQLDHGVVPVAGTEGGRAPFFSPGGGWLGFTDDNTIQRVNLAGGAPQKICDIAETASFDATWVSEDGAIVFSTDEGLWTVPSSGGQPERLTTPDADAGEAGHHLPSVLPGGERVLFTVTGPAGVHLALLSLQDRTWDILIRDAAQGHLIDRDRLLFARNGELLSTRCDPSTLRPIGTPVSAVQGVHTTPGLGGIVVTHFDLTPAGTLAYVPDSSIRADDELVWVEAGKDGKPVETRVTGGPGTWVHPRLSPKGDRISIDIHQPWGERDVYIYEIETGHLNRLTHDGVTWESEWRPPEGQRIAIMSARKAGRWGVFLADTRDMDAPVEELADGAHLVPGGWTSNGETLLYHDLGVPGIWSVGVDEQGGAGSPTMFLGTQDHERFPRLSSDGAWLAYVANELGRREVFIRPYPELRPQYRVSNNGGGEPVWSRDGTRLYFREGDELFVVDVTLEPEFSLSAPRLLFAGKYDDALMGHQHYDVALEGERFLMVKHGAVTGPSEVRVILNWRQTLDERVTR